METISAEPTKPRLLTRQWLLSHSLAALLGLVTLCIILAFLFEWRSHAILPADLLVWSLLLPILSLLVAAYLVSWRRAKALEAVNATLLREIEVRRQTEITLRASEARLRAVTHALPDRVFVMDEDGRYCDVLADPRNPALPGVISLKGRLLNEIHSPEMAEFFLGLIHGALETQQIHVAEYELPTRSGRRWFESRTVPLDVCFDNKPATIVVVRDLTERKQAEAQLRQAQKMQAIGQLTGGIAHDFNNLLAVIMGNLELLHEQLTAQPRLLDLTQQALKSVDRGTNLSRRLLAFARRQPLLAQPTHLNRLVLGMLDLIQRTLGSAIRVDKALATDLDMTLVDPGQFESALLNLVINARDAMPRGGRLLVETANVLLDKVQVAAYQEDVRSGPYVMLAVRDSGSGMKPEVLEHVFEPFFSTKDAGRGSGLGLSMVYGLVKQSGGHITIDSEPGQGATVRLYLPRIEYQETSILSEPSVSDHAHLQGQGETLLVVEDDAGVRLFAVTALERMGYDIRQAGTAATALQILDATPEIALLFTDIVLPGDMDGVQLAAEAQRRRPGLRVLFTSGYTEHALVGNGRIMEGVEVLTKPYHKSELARKLCLLLRSSESTAS